MVKAGRGVAAGGGVARGLVGGVGAVGGDGRAGGGDLEGGGGGGVGVEVGVWIVGQLAAGTLGEGRSGARTFGSNVGASPPRTSRTCFNAVSAISPSIDPLLLSPSFTAPSVAHCRSSTPTQRWTALPIAAFDARSLAISAR